ncbi:sulfurtransferase TusA family protein [Thiohalorhabdus methylotrophus]|uniref:Sulfurtransferase TusA family protein n=1 Tax=Thiohalorhabdus methylotrophus TaxID=3242694 RepID=A0ABV4TWI9_9GAMM
MTATHKVDVRGVSCPEPLQTLIAEIRQVEPGQSLELLSTDPAVEKDVRAWLGKAGHHLEEVSAEDEGVYRLRIRRKVPYE